LLSAQCPLGGRKPHRSSGRCEAIAVGATSLWAKRRVRHRTLPLQTLRANRAEELTAVVWVAKSRPCWNDLHARAAPESPSRGVAGPSAPSRQTQPRRAGPAVSTGRKMASPDLLCSGPWAEAVLPPLRSTTVASASEAQAGLLRVARAPSMALHRRRWRLLHIPPMSSERARLPKAPAAHSRPGHEEARLSDSNAAIPPVPAAVNKQSKRAGTMVHQVRQRRRRKESAKAPAQDSSTGRPMHRCAPQQTPRMRPDSHACNSPARVPLPSGASAVPMSEVFPFESQGAVQLQPRRKAAPSGQTDGRRTQGSSSAGGSGQPHESASPARAAAKAACGPR